MKQLIYTFTMGIIILLLTDFNVETVLAEQIPIEVEANDKANLVDDSYYTISSFSAGNQIIITSETPMTGIYVKWNSPVYEWMLSYNGKDYTQGKSGFLHDYIELEEATNSAIITVSKDCQMSDIYAFSEGDLPEWVQTWREPDKNADILVYSTHADDEILFLGGILATYAGEKNLSVQVCYMTNYWNGARIREHEKLDGIWEAGVRQYPINGDFDDIYATSLDGALGVYSYDNVKAFVTEQIRRFKPLVVVTQDFNGEYGHGGHMILAKAVAEAVDNSNSDEFCPESVATYGVWDVPKTYFHLYPENVINMDLNIPLEKMNGRTALQVAADAYLKHQSQQWCWFYVSDTYEYSCAKFGLYRTTVGNDTGWDMLENVKTYEEIEKEEQERLAKEEAERLEKEKAEKERLEKESVEKESEEKAAKEKKEKSKSEFKLIVAVGLVIISVIIIFVAIRTYNGKKKRVRNKRKNSRRR